MPAGGPGKAGATVALVHVALAEEEEVELLVLIVLVVLVVLLVTGHHIPGKHETFAIADSPGTGQNADAGHGSDADKPGTPQTEPAGQITGTLMYVQGQ